jgi:hypothetical protein
MKPQTTQKTLIQIPIPPQAVLLASLLPKMVENDDQRQRNSAAVFLARSTIF